MSSAVDMESRVSYAPVSETPVPVVVDDSRDSKCPRACCWSQSCIWGAIACLYFFVIIPTGILLILHGHSKSAALTLALGVVLLVVTTCGVPGVFIGIKYRRMLQQDRLNDLTSFESHESRLRKVFAGTPVNCDDYKIALKTEEDDLH